VDLSESDWHQFCGLEPNKTYAISAFPPVEFFSLQGIDADGGVSFASDDLYGPISNPIFHPKNANCIAASFRSKTKDVAEHPRLCLALKGFESIGWLRCSCELGDILMFGSSDKTDVNALTGRLLISATRQPAEVQQWRVEAIALLEHIQWVMSFGAATFLPSAIVEFKIGDNTEVQVRTQAPQNKENLDIICVTDRQRLLDSAVRSYLSSPEKAKTLRPSLYWFTHDTSYLDLSLLSAMTGLESLIAGQLTKHDQLNTDARSFKKLRKELHKVIAAHVAQLSRQGSDRAADISTKLDELNRCSLRRKIEILAGRWQVSIGDIDAEISKAVETRNRIVHEGRYGSTADDDSTVYHHVRVIRELLTRFLLAAIEYDGRYISYLGEPRFAQVVRTTNNAQQYSLRSSSWSWVELVTRAIHRLRHAFLDKKSRSAQR